MWSATSRGRPPDGGLALAVFHMVPRVPAALNLFVHPPADISAKSCSLPRLALRVCSASPSSALRRLWRRVGLHSRLRSPPSSCLFPTFYVPSAADAVRSDSTVPGSALLSSALLSAITGAVRVRPQAHFVSCRGGAGAEPVGRRTLDSILVYSVSDCVRKTSHKTGPYQPIYLEVGAGFVRRFANTVQTAGSQPGCNKI